MNVAPFAVIVEEFRDDPESGWFALAGISDLVVLNEFPGLLSELSVVVGFLVGPDEAGTQQRLRFALLDEAKDEIGERQAVITVPDWGGRAGMLKAGIIFRDIFFERPGEYEIIIGVDGEDKCRVTFQVIKGLRV